MSERMTDAGRPRRATPRSTDLEAIAAIVADAANPSLRNLKITRCYGDLSHGLAAALGPENANWCTFATWASKTAGQFIRLTRFEEHVRAAVSRVLGPRMLAVRDALHRIPGVPDLGEELMLDAARRIAADVAVAVAAGNLTVFAELAPLFARLLRAVPGIRNGDVAAVRTVTAELRRGATGEGGQDLLIQAVNDYATAVLESDVCRKAERMLRANAQVGAHEQIRLQEFIRRAMSAPFADTVIAVAQRRSRFVTATLGRATDAMIDAALRPHRSAFQQVWLEVSTEYLMTLELPTGRLHLGRDLPNRPGQPIFPRQLSELRDPELRRILQVYHADGVSARGSGATDWSNLSDRMRFILELFRSRQTDSSLFELPFGPAALAEIDRGSVPLLGV